MAYDSRLYESHTTRYAAVEEAGLITFFMESSKARRDDLCQLRGSFVRVLGLDEYLTARRRKELQF